MNKLSTFLAIILVLSLVCGATGCTKTANQDTSIVKSKTSVIIENKSAGAAAGSCPAGIIPERWILEEIYGNNRFTCNGEPCLNKFADGTPVSYIGCIKGHQVGENVNYIYCNGVYYKNQQINPDGSIVVKSILTIDMVFDSNDLTKEGYKIISSKCRS